MSAGHPTGEQPLKPLQVSSEHVLQLKLVLLQLDWSQQQMTQRSVHIHSRQNVARPTTARITHPCSL